MPDINDYPDVCTILDLEMDVILDRLLERRCSSTFGSYTPVSNLIAIYALPSDEPEIVDIIQTINHETMHWLLGNLEDWCISEEFDGPPSWLIEMHEKGYM